MLHNHLPLLVVFQKVIARGSFQATAEELNLPRSSISKKVRQLEELIGQPLLHRTTRRLRLTEAGQHLLNATGPLSDVMNNLTGFIDSMQSEPAGTVKISTSVLVGQRFIVPLLGQLRHRYPGIQLELSFDDQVVDLLADEVDIAVRIGRLPDSTLVARKIGDKRWGWFASPDYLQRNGYPGSPGQLQQHDCLVFKNRTQILNFWSFQDSSGNTQTWAIKPAILTDNGRALVDMACSGLGIIMVDPLTIQPELSKELLLPVLTDWRHPDSSPIHLLCLGKRQRSRATQCVWEFFVNHAESWC